MQRNTQSLDAILNVNGKYVKMRDAVQCYKDKGACQKLYNLSDNDYEELITQMLKIVKDQSQGQPGQPSQQGAPPQGAPQQLPRGQSQLQSGQPESPLSQQGQLHSYDAGNLGYSMLGESSSILSNDYKPVTSNRQQAQNFGTAPAAPDGHAWQDAFYGAQFNPTSKWTTTQPDPGPNQWMKQLQSPLQNPVPPTGGQVLRPPQNMPQAQQLQKQQRQTQQQQQHPQQQQQRQTQQQQQQQHPHPQQQQPQQQQPQQQQQQPQQPQPQQPQQQRPQAPMPHQQPPLEQLQYAPCELCGKRPAEHGQEYHRYQPSVSMQRQQQPMQQPMQQPQYPQQPMQQPQYPQQQMQQYPQQQMQQGPVMPDVNNSLLDRRFFKTSDTAGPSARFLDMPRAQAGCGKIQDRSLNSRAFDITQGTIPNHSMERQTQDSRQAYYQQQPYTQQQGIPGQQPMTQQMSQQHQQQPSVPVYRPRQMPQQSYYSPGPM